MKEYSNLDVICPKYNRDTYRVEELLVGVVNFEMYVKPLNIKREQSIESLRQSIRKKS